LLLHYQHCLYCLAKVEIVVNLPKHVLLGIC
jgi:hypothetical protein